MRSLRLAIAAFGIILALVGVLSAVTALVALVHSAWFLMALFGALAVVLFVIAYWMYRSWRWTSHSAGKESPGASAN
jgi:uncharacterized membrane protein